MIDYRSKARKYLKSANERLATGDDEHLRYSALDLRHAIEALTYDRANAYKKELPPDEYQTWQPKKLMAVLLEIDPTADKDSTVSIGIEETYGVPAPLMQVLGSEAVFNMGLLKKHYDALGNHLHVPTLKQMQTEPPSTSKLRQRYAEIAGHIGKVLASTIHNSTLGSFASFECRQCEKPIRKRMPHGQSDIVAECFNCSASYKIKDMDDGKVQALPEVTTAKCANEACAHPFELWRREIQRGTAWKCPACGGQNVIDLCVRHNPKTSV